MVAKPNIVWKGSHEKNRRPREAGIAPEGLVLHIAEGSMEGMASWFANPIAQVSAHFGVGKDGRVWQFVDLKDAGFTHGKTKAWGEPTASIVLSQPDLNPNDYLLGIEHEGKSGDVMTSAQFDASTRLAAWLFETVLLVSGATGVAVDRNHIIRHGEIAPLTRSRCPGYPEQTLTAYVTEVKRLLTPQTPPAPPVDPHAVCRAREQRLVDALTLQAAALDDVAARAQIQAANLRGVVTGG